MNKIKQLRLKKEMNQTEFGLAIGIQQSYVSALEVGRVNLTHEMAKKIAKKFKVSLKSLLEP